MGYGNLFNVFIVLNYGWLSPTRVSRQPLGGSAGGLRHVIMLIGLLMMNVCFTFVIFICCDQWMVGGTTVA